MAFTQFSSSYSFERCEKCGHQLGRELISNIKNTIINPFLSGQIGYKFIVLWKKIKFNSNDNN